ncbi:cell division protein CpoB [Erwinia sp. OLTSP20]|uniref:cell division protein CpoB n=1 Tax=unclassified Erwinia TaxID=2622719 RepID=UPI000C184214|nr:MULTISPECIES: cell division protein CpoB [unclassified Erwinia]PIJ48747.1 cell division protein CpoB [Erwinia sp. OAMSP11]PIJ69372.1 cell division protein CpoB [Erwinia sp. OLSSP12]PIJ79205.1 cell division protein CpoB [Erwinia sp. OLCASP19]PIJ80732.1 cell division protein CpoB [Erwinia sp. OLMTSP26]PIJ82882.1 cell division protein CpoB [Erwinia sp. OLMDSP33]
MISNFRPHLLSLSLLIGVAAITAANAHASISSVGSGSVEDRVTTLERITNAQAQLLQQQQQRLSSTQSDIDALRGQLQESQYQLSQLAERQKDLYQQLDKLNSTGGGTAQPTGADSASTAGAVNGAASNVPDASSHSDGAAPVQSGDANTDYNAAVALVLEQKQYDKAIRAFQAFVKKYPDSTYIPNANYWLGQLSYNKGKKDDAAYYFATVVKNYPKSPKSADALYKVGVIMQEKGDSAKAKAVYQQVVKQYPNTEAARQSQKRLSSL